MKLYSYWQSSAAYRVRIALNLKGIACEMVHVHLGTGEQRTDAYRSVNPHGTVPALETDDGIVITQSLAAIEYLDALAPSSRLVPDDPVLRARVKSVALTIAADVHPINTMAVTRYLQSTLGHSADETVAWMHHWMRRGFDACEALVDPYTPFAFGDSPSMADVCLVAQLYNAHRWNLAIDPWPRLARIEAACLGLPAVDAARPERQPDAPT